MMKSIYRDINWYPLQERKEDGTAERYVFETMEGKVEYEFIKRFAGLIEDVTYYDIVTTRGLGGPYLSYEGNSKDVFLKNYNQTFCEYCKQQGIIAEYVKFDPWVKNVEEFGEFYTVEYHGNVFCTNVQEDFYNNEYQTNARARIKKAKSYGVEIKFDQKGATINEFLALYQRTEEKYNVSDFYKLDTNHIKEYFELLEGKVCICNAIYHQEVISSAILLLGKDIAHYLFLGNNENYKEVQANTLLIYECANYARDLNKYIFDMGGAIVGSPNEAFKKKFVRDHNMIPHYSGKRILNNDLYMILVGRNKNNGKGYFPEYRSKK